MGRWVAILVGVLVLALTAGVLAEATLAIGHHGRIVDDSLLRPKSQMQATPTPSASSTPSTTPTPSSSLSPTISPSVSPSATPAVKTAVTNTFVNLRASKSTTSTILAGLNTGVKVQVLADSDAQWQQVQYNGLTGYIFKTYLTY